MLDIRKNSIYDVYCISRSYMSAIRTIFIGVVYIAQLVEVTDSAVQGDLVEVVSSIPAVGHKNIFQHFPASLIYYLSVCLPVCLSLSLYIYKSIYLKYIYIYIYIYIF